METSTRRARPAPGPRPARAVAAALTLSALCACKGSAGTSSDGAIPAQPMVTLMVTRLNLGGGTVTSTPPGLSCGDTCRARFPAGTTVTLSAQPDRQSAFLRFGGAACSGAACVATERGAGKLTLTTPSTSTTEIDSRGAEAALAIEVHFQARACERVRPEGQGLAGLLCQEDPVPGSATLSAAWASGPRDLWAVGESGVVWRYDGVAWYQVPLPTRPRLTGISGSAADDVWLVGFGGAVLRFDGKTFTPEALPAPYAQAQLSAVSVRGRGDVWAVGTAAILHRGADGQWAAVNKDAATGQPINDNLFAVAAVSDKDVWAAGSGGALLRYQGSGWQRQTHPVRGDLHALWAFAADNVWASGFPYAGDGGAGALLRFDGARWALQSGGAPATFFTSLWGRGAAELYAASDSGVWRWDGARFGTEALPPRAGQGGVLVGDGDGLQLLRLGGLVLRRSAAGAWSQLRGRGALWSVTAPAPGVAYAVGEAGLILAWDGQAWAPRPLAEPTEQTLYDVWGASARDVWAVGSGPTLLRAQGGPFQRVSDPALQGSLFGVFGTAADNVWFVGAQGLTYQSSGGALRAVPTGVAANLLAIHGSGPKDLWAVGNAGTLLHYTGAAWASVPAPVATDYYGVWASGPQEAYAVGDGGVLIRWDGARFARVELPPELLPQLGALRGVSGGGKDDVWVVGSGAVVLHFDGKSWALLKLRATSTSFLRVAAAGSERWLVDNYGGVLRYRP